MAPADAVSEPEELTPEQAAAVREHLKEVIASPEFAGSKRAGDFLQLIVDHTLAARLDNLRERMIGAEMFGRPIDYDTANDAVVRVKASEVRKKLTQYYSGLGQPPAVRIEIPAGSYVAKFLWENPEEAAWEKPEEADEAEPVLAPPEVNSLVPSQDGVPSESQPRFRRSFTERRRRISDRWLEVSAVVVLLAIVVYFGVREFSNRPHANSEVRSIAILPLTNLSGDPQQEYFADGMTDELITDLGQISGLRVISRTSAMTYKGTKKRLPEIARELAVDAVVEGSVLREGESSTGYGATDRCTSRPAYLGTKLRPRSHERSSTAGRGGAGDCRSGQYQTHAARAGAPHSRAPDEYRSSGFVFTRHSYAEYR